MGRSRAFAGVVALLLVSGPVDAFRPVLHEYLAPDPREDLELATTTTDGRLPSILSTNSGLVSAPDTRNEPNSKDPVYAQPWSRDSNANSYQADRNTGKPDSVPYADPFTPSIAPYKRLEAFDAVMSDGRLTVRDRATERLPATGVARADDDLFYGDITVDFTSGHPVRIPSVAAGARVLRLSTVPAATVTILRDGADNLYAQSDQRAARVRLLFEMAAPKEAFGSPRRLPSWKELGKPALPPGVARDAAQVAQAIGVRPGMSPDEVLSTMVAYFRGFVASDEKPIGRHSLYLDLALSRRGVCRHRAYAFTVTALGLGIPTRMVMNEAHAWVEVRQGGIWHRIDLGGAANQIAFDPAKRPAHHPPPDAFPWPNEAERSSGAQAIHATGSSVGTTPVPAAVDTAQNGGGAKVTAGGAPPGPGEFGSKGESSGAASAGGEPAMPLPPPSSAEFLRAPSRGPRQSGLVPPASPDQPAPVANGNDNISVPVAEESPHLVVAGEQQAQRGGPIHIRGALPVRNSACEAARVQIVLEPKLGGSRVPLGYLIAEPNGEFAGTLYLPRTIQAGDYDIVANLLDPTRADCGE